MKKLLKLEHIIILLLSIVGLILRLNYINTIPTIQLTDFETYYKVAVNVATGYGFTLDGYPIAFQGMGYSTLLGVWFKFFGQTSELLAKQLNVILSLMTIFISYYALHKMTKNKAIILLATIAIIFMPQHIAYCNVVGSEILSVFLLTVVIAVQVTSFKWQIKYPLLGVFIALLALTKPFFIAMPLVIAMIDWLTTKDFKETGKKLIIVGLVMCVLIAPWTYRNYKKFNRFIPISYNSGFNLYINNNDNNVHGGWFDIKKIDKTPELQEIVDGHLDNPLHSVKIASDLELPLKPVAMKWIKDNPFEFLKLGLIRIHSTYFNGTWDIEYWTMNEYREELYETEDRNEVRRQFNFNKSVADILTSTISVLGLLFIILNFKMILTSIFSKTKKIEMFKAVTFMLLSFVSIVYFVYEGQARYNFIVLTLLIMAASEMIVTYKEKIK